MILIFIKIQIFLWLKECTF